MKNIINKVNDILIKNDLDYLYCRNLTYREVYDEKYIIILNNGSNIGAVWVEIPNEITDEYICKLTKFYTIISDLNLFNVRYDPKEFDFEIFSKNTEVDDSLKFIKGSEWYEKLMKKYLNQHVNTITDFLINDKLN